MSRKYWEQRSAWDMYQFMEDAEETGIGDLPDMKYKWKYDNSKAGSPYRLMRDAADKKEIWDFQEKTKDGTVTEFTAQFSVKRTGGGVNGVIEFEVTMAVQSEIKQTDPA